MNDPLETVSPSSPPQPISPESMVPEPRQRRQRWAAFEEEIARTIILPKLRAVWRSHNPDTVEEFFRAYREEWESDCTLSSFTDYLRILNIKTRRITIFEGLDLPEPPAPAPAPAPTPVMIQRTIPGRAVRPAPAPAEAFDGFDNEDADESEDGPLRGTPLLEGDEARAILAALNLSPD